MGLSTLDNALWAAGFIGHVALFAVLLLRSRWREFPVFTFLIAYQAAVTLVLFVISRHWTHHTYFVTYWGLALGDYCFQVALIFEIARNVLRSAGPWVRDAQTGFLLWSAVGTLLAAGLCLTIRPPALRGLDLWEVRATLFTSLLTCELFLSISVVANRLGIRWQRHVMALGQGLVAWAAVAVTGDVAHVATGWRKDLVLFDQARMYLYLGALVFWTVSFWKSDVDDSSLSSETQESLLASHERTLDGLNPSKR